MEIEINLYKNWSEIILNEIENLKKKGFVFESFEEWYKKRSKDLKDQQISKIDLIERYQEHLLFLYFNLKVKVIERKPRKVFFPKNFTCPPELLEGYFRFIDNVCAGKSLFPYLSKNIFSTNYTDGLLFHWRIHHFHLGIQQDKKHRNFIERTGQILYAMVTDEFFYVIAVAEHGKWTDMELLKILKRNYPEALEHFKINGVKKEEPELTETELKNLRSKNVNTSTEIDGDVYGVIGGGVSSSGLSRHAVMNKDRAYFFLKKAEETIKNNMPKIIEESLTGIGFKNDLIKLKMEKLEKDKITVVCRDYGFSISLNLDGKGTFTNI